MSRHVSVPCIPFRVPRCIHLAITVRLVCDSRREFGIVSDVACMMKQQRTSLSGWFPRPLASIRQHMSDRTTGQTADDNRSGISPNNRTFEMV